MSLLNEQQKAEYEKEFCNYNIANLDLDIPFATPRKILEWLEAQQISVEPVVKPEIAEIDKMIDEQLLRSKTAVERQNYGWATEAIVADAGVSILRKLKRKLSEQFSV